jgi:hypothetical protein
MCRNIHTLYHVDPPVSQEEIHAASLQFVRKISGYNRPSKTNEAAFMTAVGEIEAASSRLLGALSTSTPARERKSAAGTRRLLTTPITPDGQIQDVDR